jgi:cystathionine gamma-synthase
VNRSRRPETVAVTAGRPTGAGDPLNVPLEPASNFRADGDVSEYARDGGTATWRAFEAALGALEGGRAVAFASGMAAVSAVLDLVPVGGRVLVPRDCYGGTRELLADGAAAGRWVVTPVAQPETEAVIAAVPGADLLWLESPSNPLLEVADVPTLVAAARDAGVRTAVDSTFATPLLQRPLESGADVVVHSVTKFLGGHSDLLMGVAVTGDPGVGEALARRRMLAGATPGALEAFLALRGLRTLPVRLRQAQESAAELARRLGGHASVERVRYPGFGAMLAFDVRGGAEAADAACAAVRVIVSATSLGGVESTIERRAKLPGQEHVPPGLLRLSVGCEHVEDLWEDLDAALASAAGL